MIKIWILILTMLTFNLPMEAKEASDSVVVRHFPQRQKNI